MIINEPIKRYIFMVLLFFVLVSAAVKAEPRIVWYTIDGGGATSFGNTVRLTGTIGQPDAGYHGEGNTEVLGGFRVGGPLCIVDFVDFANFAAHWLDGPCSAGNNWCSGADLNESDGVNGKDLSIFTDQWLNMCPYGWKLD